MNKRQKKKAFKKWYGFNPPQGISIRTAMRFMGYKETIMAAFGRLKAAMLGLWERLKQTALELAGALKEIYAAFISSAERRRRQYIAAQDFRAKSLLRQQESEVERIEGNPDIHNRDRRQGSSADKAF